MHLRRVVLALLFAAGCASATPASDKARADLRNATGRMHRRHLVMAHPTATARRSEQAPVIEEAPDPEAQRLFEQRLADPAVQLAPSGTNPKVTEMALADTVRGEAPGMRPAEDTASATLTEGQRAMMPVNLGPGDCATFIAQGGLGVIELDLFLVPADRSGGTRILAEDTGAGPIAVIGGHGRCYKNPEKAPLAAELHATVRRGAGVVLVRGYRK